MRADEVGFGFVLRQKPLCLQRKEKSGRREVKKKLSRGIHNTGTKGVKNLCYGDKTATTTSAKKVIIEGKRRQRRRKGSVPPFGERAQTAPKRARMKSALTDRRAVNIMEGCMTRTGSHRVLLQVDNRGKKKFRNHSGKMQSAPVAQVFRPREGRRVTGREGRSATKHRPS